jgi:hypothetical protein
MQQRLITRITVVEAFCISALVAGQRLPRVQQLVDREAEGDVTADHISSRRTMRDVEHAAILKITDPYGQPLT